MRLYKNRDLSLSLCDITVFFMNLVQFISAFGFGAVVTAIIQTWLNRRTEISKRNFQEKKECYIGLLEAYHRAAVEKSDEAAKNFAYWQLRCELVSPKEVRKAIQDIIDTNDNPQARNIAHENLKNTLRLDIGIAK
jgi:hypothetical protein